MNKNVKVPKPSQLTLAQVFEIFNEECPNDGMCMLIDKYAKKKGWIIRPKPEKSRSVA